MTAARFKGLYLRQRGTKFLAAYAFTFCFGDMSQLRTKEDRILIQCCVLFDTFSQKDI
jgi:hypothetical protein